MVLAKRLLSVAGAAGIAIVANGCASAPEVTQDDLAALEDRIRELERNDGRARVRLEDMEERVYLLQDRVEANRLALQRRSTESYGNLQRDYARGGASHAPAPGNGSWGGRYGTMPSASAPPPYPNIDPLRPPSNLPVQAVTPTRGQPTMPLPAYPTAAPTEEDGDDEIVVTQEDFDERYGPVAAADRSSTRSSSRSSRSQSSDSSSSRQRTPQAPVVPSSERLPVVAVDDQNRAVEEASSRELASPIAVYRQALDQFNEGQYATALEGFNRFLQSGPDDDYMDNALFWIGECHYGLGQYSTSLGFFQRVVSEYPNGNKVPDSLLKVALAYERLDDGSSARDALYALVETYPTTDAARRATERLRALE